MSRDPFVESVRATTDLVALVEESGIELRRVGREHFGLCPFHPERTPSFTVNAEVYYCFGCKATGDVFTFIQEIERIGFREAVDRLASRVGLWRTDRVVAPIVPRPAPRTRTYPPPAEVVELLARCIPAANDPVVRHYLAGRGLDVDTITDRDLAFALPSDRLPGWARIGGRDWYQSGHRCVLPLLDHQGVVTSLHARSIDPSPEPKVVFPAGHTMKGLFLADGWAERWLRHDQETAETWEPVWETSTVWVVEGVTDFLMTATSFGDAAEPPPIILGILAGSWGPALADRFLDGARVVIATDHDDAGERYAEEIAQSLRGRVRLERWAPRVAS